MVNYSFTDLDMNKSSLGSGARILVATMLRHFSFLHVKHREWEPEGVHGQLEGCNRNSRPKAAVANNNHLPPKSSAGQV